MGKKIGYIVFNESIFDNLIKTQVIGLLSEIKKNNIELVDEIYLINFLPVTKIFEVKKYLKKAKELKKNGLYYIFLPITLHSRIYFFNILFPIFGYLYGIFLKILLFFLDVDIIHCRSYFATLVGLKAKIKEKIIFDTRSLFIEENVSINKIKEKSLTYKLWKKYEKRLLEESDKIVVIDNIYKEKYLNKTNVDTNKINVIPIFVDDDIIYYDSKERNELRKKLNIEEKEVYIYTGSFYGWNDIDVYFKYFKNLIDSSKDIFIIILTKQVNLVEKKIREYDLNKDLFLCKSVVNTEVRKYLSAADYGVILMKKNKDSETRLGVKFLEYIACNLKIITNSNVGLACKIVEENNIGINIDKDAKKCTIKNESIYIFEEVFSKKNILRKYIGIYF